MFSRAVAGPGGSNNASFSFYTPYTRVLICVLAAARGNSELLSYGCSTSPIDSGIESEDARFKWVGAGCFAFALLSSAVGLAAGAATDVAAGGASAASGAAALCAVFACVEPAPVPSAA